MSTCNICEGTTFVDFNNRRNVQCVNCKSLERHRLVREVLKELGLLNRANCLGTKRALHLAPEAMTYRYLAPVFGSGYYCSDMHPEKYPHCQALKLCLPDGFEIFTENYFDLIIHNHVLEHIPGSFRDHLKSFINIIKPGGYMIFTIPFVNRNTNTIEGGEVLPSDADRINIHGQKDHYKTFGNDLLEYLENQNGYFCAATIDKEKRETIIAPNDTVYIFKKN